jgi:hypothetical protein
MRLAPSITVAADFNPLLLFVARTVTRGDALELYEFPIAPRQLRDHALLRRLAAPEPARPGFFLVAADALRPPFASGTFDTVVTPWFIDIIGEDFSRFAARVNGLLRTGGAWISFGSLSFAQGERALRFSAEEVAQLVEQAGFTRPQSHEESIPYMQSPASRHGRVETVLTWCATKEHPVPESAPHSELPDWLIGFDQPVPLLEDFQVQAISTRIHAFVMALIDGRRSVRDMARMLVEQRLMAPQDAESSVRNFLTRMYEDSRKRAGY